MKVVKFEDIEKKLNFQDILIQVNRQGEILNAYPIIK